VDGTAVFVVVADATVLALWLANTVLSRMPKRASTPSSNATTSPGPHALGDCFGAYAIGLHVDGRVRARRNWRTKSAP
jgi:hypothetical protein